MRSFCLALASCALIAASGPVQPQGEPLDVAAARALAEARTAEARMTELQKAADEAKSEAERLLAKQAAATQAIEAADARISAADANARLIGVLMAERRDRLAREQAPAGSLLAGLALMAERPPLLAILDQGSTEEFVRVRLLLDSTLPIIRKRTSALRDELDRGRKLQVSAELARRDLVQSRDTLAQRKREFAELETEARKLAAKRGGEALGAAPETRAATAARFGNSRFGSSLRLPASSRRHGRGRPRLGRSERRSLARAHAPHGTRIDGRRSRFGDYPLRRSLPQLRRGGDHRPRRRMDEPAARGLDAAKAGNARFDRRSARAGASPDRRRIVPKRPTCVACPHRRFISKPVKGPQTRLENRRDLPG